MPDDITNFVPGESGIDGDGQIVKPELGFPFARADVNVGGFIAFVGVEEGAIPTAELLAPSPHSSRCAARTKPQYLFAIGNSSAGNSVITRHPLSVTTTSSSMRAAE